MPPAALIAIVPSQIEHRGITFPIEKSTTLTLLLIDEVYESVYWKKRWSVGEMMKILSRSGRDSRKIGRFECFVAKAISETPYVVGFEIAACFHIKLFFLSLHACHINPTHKDNRSERCPNRDYRPFFRIKKTPFPRILSIFTDKSELI